MQPLVVDNGSDTIKAGYSGEDRPRAVFRSEIACLRRGTDADAPSVTNDSVSNRSIHPIQHGRIVDWAGAEQLWSNGLRWKLGVAPEHRAVLMTETSLTPKEDRMMMTEIMFESFQLSSLFVCLDAVLALHSSDRTVGLVVDSGHCVTQIVPIYEGYALPQTILRLPISGQDLTDFQRRRLSDTGHSFCQDIVRDIKEQLGYVAVDFEKECQRMTSAPSLANVYKLPDGEIVRLENDTFTAPEALFQPSLIGSSIAGLHEIAYNSLMRSDRHLRFHLCGNIVLSGGNTMMRGLAERLEKELSALIPYYRNRVIAPPERVYSSWRGGSLLSSLSTFRNMCMTKNDYEESGPIIVQRFCWNGVSSEASSLMPRCRHPGCSWQNRVDSKIVAETITAPSDGVSTYFQFLPPELRAVIAKYVSFYDFVPKHLVPKVTRSSHRPVWSDFYPVAAESASSDSGV